MSEPKQQTVFNDNRGPIIPKVDVGNKNKRPRSHSNHSARSTGSSNSSGSSFGESSSGSPTTGNLSPTPPSISASEEDMDYYFGLESQNHFVPGYGAAPPRAVREPPTYCVPAEYNSGYPSVIPRSHHHGVVHHPAMGYFQNPHTMTAAAYPSHPMGMPSVLPFSSPFRNHPQQQHVAAAAAYPFGLGSTTAGFHEVHQASRRSTKRMMSMAATPTAGGGHVVRNSHNSKRTTTASHHHLHHHPGGMTTTTTSVIPPSVTSSVSVVANQQQQQGHAFQREGSLRLQEFIPSASTEQRQAILNDLQRDLPQLSRTPYGNYVVQKLIQHGTPQQRLTIVQVLKHHFETLATDLYGHRVVSKALEYGDDTCKSIILGSLLSCFKDMVNDEHGNYVAQKCIKTLATYQCEAIWEKFFGRVWITATHKFGHCVLKTLFLYAPTEVKDRILAEMSKNVILLAKDPYGNYVLQHILDKEQYGDLLPRHNIIGSLLDQFDDLSCNKFASNVVEKCLRCTDTQMLDGIVYRFCATSNKKLGKLINNPFGNYVVKTLLNLCDGKQKERIRNRCVRIYQRIRCSCAVPAIFGECRMELERRFRERRPDVMDDDDEDDEDDTDDDRSSDCGSSQKMMM